jgi:O-antigen/teichoic acid export membrane protein
VNSVRINTVANLIGQGWGALLQLVVVPFYLHFLGIESYALVGFYLMLITGTQLFDLGLAQTLNRELARLSAAPSRAGEARAVLRTIETVYWAVIAAVCAALLLATPFLSAHVLNPKDLSSNTLHVAILLMVVVIALQWPAILYQSGLMGLQRQLLINSLRAGLSTISSVGAVLTLWLVSPTIVAFFAWQIAISAITLACMAYALYASLPPATEPARFRGELLRRMWRFAAGMSALTISALVLTQLDKWLLVKILPLDQFGYFMLAVTVANALNLIVSPVFGAVFPRFSALIASGEHGILISVYKVATQALAASLLPLALFLSMFSYEVLWLWTGNPVLARNSGPLLSLLAIGTALNGLSHLPYAWELARGRTRFILAINLVLIAALAPSLWYFANRYGAIAAPALWLAVNAIYLIVFVPVVHRALKPRDRRQWFLRDIGLPLSVSTAILGALRIALPPDMSKPAMAITLGVALSACLAAAAFSSRGLRHALRRVEWNKADPLHGGGGG